MSCIFTQVSINNFFLYIYISKCRELLSLSFFLNFLFFYMLLHKCVPNVIFYHWLPIVESNSEEHNQLEKSQDITSLVRSVGSTLLSYLSACKFFNSCLIIYDWNFFLTASCCLFSFSFPNETMTLIVNTNFNSCLGFPIQFPPR